MKHHFIKLHIAAAVLLLSLVPLWAWGQTLQGDVDGDGKVNISDVTTLIDYLLSSEHHSSAADVDDDGMVSINDVTFLIDFILAGRTIEIIEVTPTVKIKMVKIEGGSFMMGASDSQEGDAAPWQVPQHKVTVGSFLIGQTEVTQELWQAVMGSNPSRFTDELRPVEGVNWHDCQQFITRLRAMTGRDFRLPSEAEWEFAARGGNKGKGYTYSGSNDATKVSWWGYNILASGDCTTHPVGMLAANELGIHDMSGNVWEWCQDWFAPYSAVEQTNPTGAATGTCKILRGGCWSGESRYCRVWERFYFAPELKGDIIGLRLAL